MNTDQPKSPTATMSSDEARALLQSADGTAIHPSTKDTALTCLLMTAMAIYFFALAAYGTNSWNLWAALLIPLVSFLFSTWVDRRTNVMGRGAKRITYLAAIASFAVSIAAVFLRPEPLPNTTSVTWGIASMVPLLVGVVVIAVRSRR